MTIGLSNSEYSSEWRKYKEKDGEEQEEEVEREKRVKEGAPWMFWRWLSKDSGLEP